MTEYCYVIMRDDGKFFYAYDWFAGVYHWGDEMYLSLTTYERCCEEIKEYNLQNCKPVKVKIDIVGEEE